MSFGNRTRRAKRRRKEIAYAKNAEERQGSYRDLLRDTTEVYEHGLAVRDLLQKEEVLNGLGLFEALAARGVAEGLGRFLPLTQQVMDQTRRPRAGGSERAVRGEDRLHF